MKSHVVPALRCPICDHAVLSLCVSCEQARDIESGTLQCCDCLTRFPIVRGVPRFVSRENHARTFGFQWNHFRRTQLDSATGTAISRERFYVETDWTPDMLKGRLVLDAGCGAGRFAEVALDAGATVFAFDYSDAVDACWKNLGAHPEFHLVQADIFSIPLKRRYFDFIYSFGVLMHTGDPRRAFMSLAQHLKSPGGRLVIDVYAKSWRSYVDSKYWLRPLTKRLPTPILFQLIQIVVPLLLPITNLVGRLPNLGRRLKRIVPIADYRGIYLLSDSQIREWAVLDTFDMLSARYDAPQTPHAVRRWFEDASLGDIEMLRPGHLVGRGRAV